MITDRILGETMKCLGATAFEFHNVDIKNGRIKFGEVDEALNHGRWAPGFLTERLGKPGVIEAIRNDPDFALFVTETFKMVGRLIINEGGWGVTDEIDLVSSPMHITYKNSNEARWNSPAQEPVCYHSAGGIAGYLSRLLGEELHAKEIYCTAMGSPMCVFEIRR